MNIPNTDVETWVRSFDHSGQRDYGIEYLTAATHGNFTKIPFPEKYSLPESVNPVSIEESLEKAASDYQNMLNRIKSIRYNWKKGEKPKSLMALDELRSQPGTYHVDLLENNGVPKDHPVIPSLTYLVGSILVAGDLSPVRADIMPNTNNTIEQKLIGAITTGHRAQGRPYILQQSMTRLLCLIGIGTGKQTNQTYEQLGLGFIEQIEDPTRFVEAIMDHRLTITGRGFQRIRMPCFTQERTSLLLGQLLEKAFQKTFPQIPYKIKTQQTYHKQPIYQTVLYISQRYPIIP